jgi:hypothetical protein
MGIAKILAFALNQTRPSQPVLTVAQIKLERDNMTNVEVLESFINGNRSFVAGKIKSMRCKRLVGLLAFLRDRTELHEANELTAMCFRLRG